MNTKRFMKRFYKTRDVVEYLSPKYMKGSVLDLGAGTAKYKNIILKHAGSYIAYDAVPGAAIDVVGDVHKLNFKDSSFDTVISTQVFEHIKDHEIAAEEIKRVLKGGGTAIVCAPFLIPFHADPDDFRRFTNDGLAQVFKKMGFQIVESNRYGYFWTTISEMIHFEYFSPYQKQGGLKMRVFNLLQRFLFFLDKFSHTKNIYANSFVVVKKL